MVSNNNNDDDNNNPTTVNNNNKCSEHITDNIVGICTQCDNVLVCMQCIFGAHNAHKIGKITSEIVDPILKELQTITLPILNESLKQNKSQLVKSDNQLNQLESNHTKHINQIESTFQQIINNITSVKRDLIRQLETTLNENRETHSVQHSSLDNNNKLIDSLNTLYNNNNDNNKQQDNIEILRNNSLSKILLSNSNNNTIPTYFKKSQLNENNIDEIKDSIKSLFTITTTIYSSEEQQEIQIPNVQPIQEVSQIPPNSREVKWGSMVLQLCREGITFKEGTYCLFLAADNLSRLSTTAFPSTADRLMLLNGFNESLASIPKSITILYIFDIDLQLLPGTIPNHIKSLLFCDGFNQTITKGIIPPSVNTVYLCDIVKPLNCDSIPKNVTHIYKSPSFKHTITSHINPTNWADMGNYKYVV